MTYSYVKNDEKYGIYQSMYDRKQIQRQSKVNEANNSNIKSQTHNNPQTELNKSHATSLAKKGGVPYLD